MSRQGWQSLSEVQYSMLANTYYKNQICSSQTLVKTSDVLTGSHSNFVTGSQTKERLRLVTAANLTVLVSSPTKFFHCVSIPLIDKILDPTLAGSLQIPIVYYFMENLVPFQMFGLVNALHDEYQKTVRVNGEATIYGACELEFLLLSYLQKSFNDLNPETLHVLLSANGPALYHHFSNFFKAIQEHTQSFFAEIQPEYENLTSVVKILDSEFFLLEHETLSPSFCKLFKQCMSYMHTHLKDVPDLLSTMNFLIDSLNFTFFKSAQTMQYLLAELEAFNNLPFRSVAQLRVFQSWQNESIKNGTSCGYIVTKLFSDASKKPFQSITLHRAPDRMVPETFQTLVSLVETNFSTTDEILDEVKRLLKIQRGNHSVELMNMKNNLTRQFEDQLAELQTTLPVKKAKITSKLMQKFEEKKKEKKFLKLVETSLLLKNP